MQKAAFPYGKTKLCYNFREEKLLGVLTSSIEEYKSKAGEEELIEQALRNPMESLPLLMHATVIYVSEMPDDSIEKMHMVPAHSLDEALVKAKEILGKREITITAIPNGVSVMVQN